MADRRTPQLNDVASERGEVPEVAWWRAAAIAGAALALAIGSLVLVWLLVKPLTLMLVAIIIAQALAPIVDWGERWLPRSMSVIAVYAVLGVTLGGIGWLALPALIDQADMLANRVPDLLDRAQDWFGGFNDASSSRMMSAAESVVQRFSDVLLALPFVLFSSMVDFLLVVFMSIYWLIATPTLHHFGLSLFPGEQRNRVASVMHDMGRTMGGFVRGTVIDAVIVGLLTYIGLQVIGVEYPLLLAVIQGFGELLPVVGPIIAAIPAMLVAFAHSPEQAIAVIVFFLILQQVESNLLVPLIMRRAADVPPLLSLMGILAGSTLGGLPGALIAIPLVGALRVLLMRVLVPAEREWTGAGDAQRQPDENVAS